MKLESTNKRDEVVAVQLSSKSKLERDPSAANVTTKTRKKKKLFLKRWCSVPYVHEKKYIQYKGMSALLSKFRSTLLTTTSVSPT